MQLLFLLACSYGDPWVGTGDSADSAETDLPTDNDGDGWTTAQGDCDDDNADVNPKQDEVADNEIDDDCDEMVDERNSDQLVAGDLAITELQRSPKITTGEWLELMNVSATPVNLAGLALKPIGAPPWVLPAETEVWAMPGERVVLAQSMDTAESGGVTAVAAWGSSLSLESAPGLLLLASELEMDKVPYGDWPKSDGSSLELQGDPATVDNSLAENWCLAADSYGTGGAGTPGEEPGNCLDI